MRRKNWVGTGNQVRTRTIDLPTPRVPTLAIAPNLGPESSSLPPDTDELRDAAQDLWHSKENFKKLSARRRIAVAKFALKEAREDVSIVGTSDVEADMGVELGKANYTLGIDLRVYYINKRKAFSKNLEDSTRHTFDLAHVEDAFNDSIEPLIGDEDYRIISITASVKLFSGRGRARVQDIADFSAIETDRILKIIDTTRGEHPRSALYVLFEVKIDCNALTEKKKKKQETPKPVSASTVNNAGSAPSSPLATTARSRSSRTSRLLDEQTVRQSSRTAALEKIGTAGEFQRELMQKYRCIDQNCTNYNNYCYFDPRQPRQHFNITARQHESWANSISSGQATLEQPLNFWTIGKVFREQSLASLVNQSSILQCSN